MKQILNSLLVLATTSLFSFAYAHTGSSTGWLHPLTGVDHLLAMIAVGAWSVQLGGRAVWIVPSAFVCFMLIGGIIGFEHFELPATEVGVSFSVVLLGLAIYKRKILPVAVAASATALFGIFHGYAHGYEMPVQENKWLYTLGFMAMTATLHLVGAFGAHFLLKAKSGDRILRALGGLSALCGVWLVSTVI
ncbi:HupE/UreJ family protein [Serratia proteamaculans]|uniref:HupE/UreJ family protein n=1 Tax=Serratia proteamaculans TaxID=28151 RepID=UPI0010764537|nr:HupE/UreJ family protein [Serratia proteamaculans]TFZ52668.1 HupE/UreJ family protein [Serratia proteamaculans]